MSDAGARERQPVIVGVGQLRHNRERSPEDALEPLELIDRAAAQAAGDAGLERSALSQLDAIGVVQVASWSYEDLPAAIAGRLGAAPSDGFQSSAGGHQPVAVLARLAAGIAAGESRMALLCGGEAQSSLELLGAVKDPSAAGDWSHDPGGVVGFDRSVIGTERMWDLGLVAPIRVYPLFENRLRHDLAQSYAEAQDWSARMYARFSEVAAGNDAAWNPEALSARQIAEPTDRNRMICFPYVLRMNALNRVDQAAAVLVCSAAHADRLGISEERRVHVRSAALADDCEDVVARPSFGRSAGLGQALDGALAAGHAAASELDVVDLYSCFPVVPKLAGLHLGLDGVELSATGGLSSFGGPHNNYSSHALVAVVRRLRESPGLGLVYANGEYLTKHAAAVLGSAPGPDGFALAPAAPEPETADVDDAVTGELVVETYTVEFDREGQRARGYVIGRTPQGAQSGVRVSRSDTATLDALVSETGDPVGAVGRVVEHDGRRTFSLAA